MRRLILILTVILVASYVFAKVGGGDIVYKVSTGDVTFSHERHVELGFACKSCHPEPYLTKEKHKKVS
ncbi:MAG: cytochrome c3 family protein, partial [Proteobacteria bacterium]|nr:cytochrome c3 family protein [Pseudomonadota bacterium]